ncbi:hypothetical protein H8959_007228 [Pygathrix nigripes]
MRAQRSPRRACSTPPSPGVYTALPQTCRQRTLSPRRAHSTLPGVYTAVPQTCTQRIPSPRRARSTPPGGPLFPMTLHSPQAVPLVVALSPMSWGLGRRDPLREGKAAGRRGEGTLRRTHMCKLTPKCGKSRETEEGGRRIVCQ